jgi:protein-disulfide isomerase
LGEKTGVLLVVSALILGASVVAGSLLIKSSLDQAASELSGLRSGLGQLAEVAKAGLGARPSAAPSGRPDPNRRYSVNIKGSPFKGPSSAKLAVVEFSDFQCPFCKRVGPTLTQVEEAYGDKVRIVFKHLPLRIHSKAPAAHAAAEAAHRQGKFWEMHDAIFAQQKELEPEKFVEYAEQIGLDMEKFKADLVSKEVKQRVDADAEEAKRLGVTGTPGFFINGRFLSGAQPFESFKRLIDEELGKV